MNAFPSTWPAAVLRRLPARLAQSLYFRAIRASSAAFPEVFRRAPLRFAPGLRMDLVPGDECHGVIAFTGFYELEVSRYLVREARRGGGLLVDVGANFGYHSLLWAGQDSGCRCLAFEASPAVHAGLARNIASNQLSARVDARQVAVSDKDGTRFFEDAPAGQTGSGRVADGGRRAVPATTLDRELAGEEEAVLKVDAEGHDFAVLCGAEESFRRRLFRHVFWEAFVQDFESPAGAEFCRIAWQSGYTWAPLNPRHRGQQIFHAERGERRTR